MSGKYKISLTLLSVLPYKKESSLHPSTWNMTVAVAAAWVVVFRLRHNSWDEPMSCSLGRGCYDRSLVGWVSGNALQHRLTCFCGLLLMYASWLRLSWRLAVSRYLYRYGTVWLNHTCMIRVDLFTVRFVSPIHLSPKTVHATRTVVRSDVGIKTDVHNWQWK